MPCAAHSQNPEIACQSQDCVLGLCNLEIARHQCTISRSHGTGAQSRDCTIEPFKFPSYIKVRDICNKLLQLRRHLQCQACILKPPHQGILGSSPTRRNSLPFGLGMGTERSQTWRAPPFKASPSLKVLNSLPLVSRSHAASPLRSQIMLAQSRDCANVLRSLKMGCVISGLAGSFGILRMRSAISRLRKFLD